MQSIEVLDLSGYPRKHVQDSVSPFRYPGGKAFLSGYLAERLSTLSGPDRHYAEPFCGGAGAALNLLKDGYATQLHLNDADLCVYSAWKAIVFETDRFLERLHGCSVTVDEWHTAQNLISQAHLQCGYSFELGFAAFYINRTSRSGILLGSGPIGGYNQTGKWKVDARFYKDSMASRIEWIGGQRSNIALTNEDALAFMARSKSRIPVNNALFFVDPPYIQAGSRLYLNAMSESKHSALADMLQSGRYPHWVLTYDNDPLVHRLYANCYMRNIQVKYSLRAVRKEKEVLVLPDYASTAVRNATSHSPI